MDIFAKEYFPVLKRLVSQKEEQTNQISFILSSENKLVQNDMEDEEETALKTAEVLLHEKQSKLQPSKMDRDITRLTSLQNTSRFHKRCFTSEIQEAGR